MSLDINHISFEEAQVTKMINDLLAIVLHAISLISIKMLQVKQYGSHFAAVEAKAWKG